MHGTERRSSESNSLNSTRLNSTLSSVDSKPNLEWRISSQVKMTSGSNPTEGASNPVEASTLRLSPASKPFDPFEDRSNTNASIGSLKTEGTNNTLQVAAETPSLQTVPTQSITQAAWLGSPARPDQLGNQTAKFRSNDSASIQDSPDPITLSAPIRNSSNGFDSRGSVTPRNSSVLSEPLRDVQPTHRMTEESRFLPPSTTLMPPSLEDLSSAEQEDRLIEIEPPKNTFRQPASQSLTAPRIAELPELPAAAMTQPTAPRAFRAQATLALPNRVQEQKPLDQNPFPADEIDLNAKQNDSLRSRLSGDEASLDIDKGYGSGTDYLSASNLSCEEFRDRIAAQTIDQISLDISPPFRPDEFDQRRHEELLSDFIDQQPIRDWTTNDGQMLGSGRLIDLAYEKAIIERDNGDTIALPMSQLNEGDLAHINSTWGLPRECRIEQVAYQPRDWAPSKVTWTASNLCHNPLYFESVNLERYGHTRGPVMEPVVQSAHFFGNILILPYKMGVHGPRECQYALGYYRPGNEAPWIKQPLPISARGALAQAATMTGLFWLIP